MSARAIGKYRAKADCRAGGFFRRAGEEFEMPALDVVPAHLEEVGAKNSGKEDIGAGGDGGAAQKAAKTAVKKGAAKAQKPAAVSKKAQIGKEDIGATPPTPAADVTSVDMVTQ